MSTYREIHGKAIKSLSTDPSDANVAGQVWYNTDSTTFKTVVSSAAWRSGTSFSTSGYGAAGSGSLTAGLIMGRNTLASGDTPSNATEEWNGSGWATGGNLSTARYYGGALGTQTATVFVGGDSRPPGSGSQTTAENYNGTSWTSGTAYPEAVNLSSGFGTTSAGVMCNGSDTTYSSTTKEYDGSWTAGGSLSTARRWIGTAGTQTSGLAFGGQIPPSGYSTNVTEEYGGTSWTSGGNLNAARAVNAVGGGINQDASQTNALASGGYQSSGSPKTYFNETEAYDGTSWSTQPTMTTARGYGTGGGTGSAGIVVGAYTGSLTTAVEEFNSSINVITAGAFSSGGTVPQIVRGGASGGIQTAAWITGGLQYPGDTKNKTWTYDGASWSSAEDLPSNYLVGGGVGPATAGLAWDGIGSYGPGTNTYEWDGTNWTAGGSAPAIGPGGNSYNTGAGVGQTAAVAIGGIGDPPPASSDRMIAYDGSSWSTDESLPAGIAGAAGDGPNTAIWIAGGRNDTVPSSPTDSKEYDGSSWTTTGSLVNPLPEGISFHGWGTQTAAIVAGGNPAADTVSQQYNGTTWATAPSLSTGRDNNAYCSKTSGSQTGFIAGGYSGSGNTGATEEYNAETTAINVKTLTQS